MAGLHLKVLGGFEARLASGEPLDIAARKTRALLTYLALPAGRPHSRDKLVGLLWSDRSDEQARNSLRQALAELVRALATVEPSPLVKGRDSLALDADAVEVDALLLERLSASDDIGDLRRGAALYTADLLEGFDARDPVFEEWLRGERRRVRDLATTVLKRLLTYETGPSAIDRAQRLLAIDPLQEEGHRALMRLHAEAGETGAALRQYELCRDLLKRDLDAAPSPETEALCRELRQRGTSAAAPPVRAPIPPADERQPDAALSSKPTIAVLPFSNLSGDPEQQYFSDGITEDIITQLSRFHELSVIARNSSFRFRDKSADVKHIGEDLGVDHLVEGSVRKAGNRIRISAQLVAVASGAHLWADHYDRALDDVFAIQDEVAQTIVATLVGRLSASGADTARRKPAQSWAAYDCFLQGRDRLNRYEGEEAEPLLRRAIELDPHFAQAHATLAVVHVFRFFSDGRAEKLREALVHAQKAMSLDESDAACHLALATVYVFMHRLDLAGVHYRKAVALNPSHMEAALGYAHWLARMGRTGEALEKMDAAVERDPFPPNWYWEMRAIPLLQEKRYEEMLEVYERIDRLQVWHHPYLAIANAHLGRIAEAKAHAAELLRLKPDFSAKWISAMEPYKNPADLQNLLDGLRKAGLPQ